MRWSHTGAAHGIGRGIALCFAKEGARVAVMDIEVYSSAHWQLRQGTEVAEFLRESRNYCLHVENQLLELAHRTDRFTMKEAIPELGSQLGSWQPEARQFLSFPFAGNLARLVQCSQRETGRNNDQHITWSLSE